MKLDELRTVQSKERRKDSLQQLRDSFYGDVAAYIQDLRASRDRRAKQVDDPFSDNEVRQLSDELDTAKEVAEAVYERRVGKVVKLASFAAADMPVDDEGMTTEERELFEDLVSRISQNKQTVLDVLSGDSTSSTTAETSTASDPQPTAPTPPAERTAEPEAADPSDSMLADAMGSSGDSAPNSESPTDAEPPVESSAEMAANEVPPPEAEPEPDVVLGTSTDGGTASGAASQPSSDTSTEPSTDTPTEPSTETAPGSPVEATAEATETVADSQTPTSESTDEDDSDRTTVRITKNVGDIFGVDGREYTLRSEDVVTLPTANADPLVDRDAAMRLD